VSSVSATVRCVASSMRRRERFAAEFLVLHSNNANAATD
jgi:hypothetical protein